MPAIRPEAISNRIRLAYEFATKVWAFVSENGAVDSALAAVINEPSPSEQGICVDGSENDFFTGADENFSFSAIRILVAAVMPLIEFKAVNVSILC